MLRAIIIDDEPIGVNTLKILLERLDSNITVVATSTDPKKGITLIENYRPDIVFLDISMPKIDGFQLIEQLQFKDFKLVFTTAHQEFALKAIKNRAYDYLLKPIEFEELRNCIQSLSATRADNTSAEATKSKSLLEIPVANGTVYIKQINIIKLEADGSYCNIYTKDGNKSTVCRNLKHFESMMDDTIFYRCHKSYVINLNEVLKLVSEDGYHAVMSDKSLVEISRNNKSEFVARLKTL